MVDEAREGGGERQRRAATRRDSRIAATEPTVEERRRRRLALIIIGALVAVIVGAVAAGYVVIFVLPPQQLIVRVNDVEYTRGDMVKLLRLRQRSLELVDSQGLNTTDDIFQALQTIVENEVIAQAAPGQGISVSRDEVTNSIRAVLSPSAADSQGKSAAQIEREFRERHRQFLNATQVSEAEHRDLVRKSLLREKFRQFAGDQVPAYAEQVYLHRVWMNVQNEEIDVMQTKLADAIGDDKSPRNIRAVVREIAREFSADPETFRTGGEMGWVPLGIHEDYEYDFWDLEVGELSPPVPNVDDPRTVFFFILSDRSENHAVSRINRDALKTRALQIWINEERQNHDVYATFNSEVYAWFVEQLRISTTITPTPVGNPLQNFMQGL